MCTLLGKVLTNQTIIASTSDNPYSARTFLLAFTPNEGYRFMGTILMDQSSNVPWNGMMTRGINEKGVAFTYSFVPGNQKVDSTEQSQRKLHEFTKELLSTCKTTDEAVDYLREGVPFGATGNYLLCDSRNSLTVVEISGEHFHVSSDSLIIRTNVFRFQDETEHSDTEYAYGGRTSYARFERSHATLTKAETVYDIWNALTDHNPDEESDLEYGISVCNHGTKSGTISAELLIPSSKSFIYQYGNPCGKSRENLNPSWSSAYAFDLLECEDGILTDVNGKMTELGMRFAKRHFGQTG